MLEVLLSCLLYKINCSLIPESEIIKEKKIGEGAFGKVYKGTYKNPRMC